MLSYLSSPSTSSTSNSLSAQEQEKIKQFKAQMTAIPSGMVRGSSSEASRRGQRRNLVSKAYNTVSARPLADKLNRMREYRVHGRVDGTFITSSASVPTFGALNFTIANIANSSIYLACFDQYKFEEIEIWIEPSAGAANVPTNVGILATTVDLDDSTTPSSFGVVESAQSALVTTAVAGHYHKFQPHMAVAVYSGAFTSFANAPADWIDSGSSSVQHYGLKGAISNTSYVSTWSYSVRAKIAFRQTL